jgi:hypothetical protein
MRLRGAMGGGDFLVHQAADAGFKQNGIGSAAFGGSSGDQSLQGCLVDLIKRNVQERHKSVSVNGCKG